MLVLLNDNTREVTFSGSKEQLLTAIRKKFKDVLGLCDTDEFQCCLQVWKKKWNEYVDLEANQEILDGCKIKAVVQKVKCSCTCGHKF